MFIPSFGSFEDLPPEIQEQINAQRDMDDMSTENYHNSVHHLFDDLGPEHLATLGAMLHNITISPRGQMLAAYYEGQVQMLLKYKHNVCPVHGVNHDEEALAEMNNESSDPLKNAAEALGGEFVHVEESVDPLNPEPHSEAWNLLMNEYNLEAKVEGEVLLYRCKNCGLPYRDLEDRMLKPSDECMGCIEKAKWG